MKMMRKTTLLAIFAAISVTFLATFDASAQRTAYGERLVGLYGTAAIHPAYGIQAEFGQYLLNGYWTGGLVLEDHLKVLEVRPTGQRFGNARVEGYGSFLFRIFGTRNRQLSVYGGGDVFLGFELLDPFKQLDEPNWNSMVKVENAKYKEYRFIYGVSPRATVEFFVMNDLAVTAGIRIPVTLNGGFKQDLVDFTGVLGMRYNF